MTKHILIVKLSASLSLSEVELKNFHMKQDTLLNIMKKMKASLTKIDVTKFSNAVFLIKNILRYLILLRSNLSHPVSN